MAKQVLSSTERAANILAMFSASQRDALVEAIQLNPMGIKARAHVLDEASNMNLSPAFKVLDVVPDASFNQIIVGLVASIRVSRALIVTDASFAKTVANFYGIPATLITRLMPDASDLHQLALASQGDVKKSKALKVAKILQNVFTAQSAGSIAARILPMYYFLGKALGDLYAVGGLMVATISEIAERGDPFEEGESVGLNTIGLQEVGDAIEEGDIDEQNDPSTAAAIYAGSSVAGSAFMSRRRRIRARRRRARLARMHQSDSVKQALVTATGHEEPVVREAKARVMSAPVEPDPDYPDRGEDFDNPPPPPPPADDDLA